MKKNLPFSSARLALLIIVMTILSMFSVNHVVAQTSHGIDVSGIVFTPDNLTIGQGDTVVWTNTGGLHNVNGSTAANPNNPEAFLSGVPANAPWTFSHVFNTSGNYDYQCDEHVLAGMVGAITVTGGCDVDGATVATTTGLETVTTCVDGQPDVISFDNTSSSTEDYSYLITDVNDTILGVPPGNSQDFDPAGPGECHVYGASFTGTLAANPGMHISAATSDDCFELSTNWIVVIRQDSTACFTGLYNDKILPFDIHVSPIPAINILNVSIANYASNEPVYFEIYNVLGELMNQYHHLSAVAKIELDISDYSSGQYILFINNSKVRSSTKFIKE